MNQESSILLVMSSHTRSFDC